MANTEYTGEFANQSSHKVVQWFWDTVRGFEQEQKAKLLQFVTGEKYSIPSSTNTSTPSPILLHLLLLLVLLGELWTEAVRLLTGHMCDKPSTPPTFIFFFIHIEIHQLSILY